MGPGPSGELDSGTADPARFRHLPPRTAADDARTEALVDEDDNPEDRRLWWAAVQQALNDA